MSGNPHGQDASDRCTLTRQQVAARLGVSVSSVRRLEFAELHPVRGPNGALLFDPAEVDRIPKRHPRASALRRQRRGDAHRAVGRTSGRVAARVFQMFAKNWPLAQIVIATKQPPEAIRSLYHEWVTPLQVHEWGDAD
jgi:transcriptional regulator with XRE-family HTH domain